MKLSTYCLICGSLIRSKYSTIINIYILNGSWCLKLLVTIPNMIVLPYYEVLVVFGQIAKHVKNLKVGVVKKGVT